MGFTRNMLGAVMLLGAGCLSLSAQVVANRISSEINTLSTVSLEGSANPHALTATSAGSLPGGTRIEGMTLHFALSSTQKAELDALIVAQQTQGSSSYHQWLTPAQYATRYGMSSSDLAKVESWLGEQGFSVDRVSNSRTSVSFSGTSAQVESAFGTQMRRFSVNGETHFANATNLTIPSALSGVVSSVSNLNDFRPKPHVQIRSADSSKLTSMFTSSSSGSNFLTPKDVATIYDINSAYNAGYTGTGQSIAVVGQSSIVTSDITNFQSAAGLTTKTPTLVLVPSTGSATVSTGDEAESDLDLEYTGGIAKGATIYFVYVGGNSNYSVWDSIAYAVDTLIAPIISVSYGTCETELSTSDYKSLEAIMQQGASQGQSIIASSGDDGSTSCYQFTDLTTAQRNALVVSYPASSAYVTALGGTMFPAEDVCKVTSSSSSTATCGANASTYWSTASGSDVISSARSYIPEVVWNNNSSSGLSSGGGGVSVWTTRPSWQTGVTGITMATDYSKGYRMVPDISLSSSSSNAGYLYCSSDSTSTGITGSCSNGFRDSNGTYLTVAGGTSFAAPVFAGMLAILNQKQNSSGQGLINSTLYTLASNATTYASAFHDITSGTNACSGISTCTTAGSAYYAATTGYDEATGIGSVDFYNLLSDWPATTASSLASSTTTLTAATSTPTSGASDTITIKVATASSTVTATPTGTVSVTVDGTTVNSSLALSSGVATYSFSSTTSGAHTIAAAYSGDTNYAASTGSVVVTIGSSSSSSSGSFTISLSPAAVTIASGSSGTTSVVVTPANSYTGTVSFSLTTSNTYLQNYACYTISSASVTGTSAVTKTLTLHMGKSACSSVGAVKSSVQSFKAASSGAASNDSKSAPNMHGGLAISMAGLGVIGFVLAGWAGRKRHVLQSMLGLALIALLGGGFSGCSSSTTTTSSTNVPKGSYSITVEGDDSSNSSLYSTATLTLTVD